ncbi:hypothetical protein BZZ01_12120 [Nostocales cyanobacterium HT-58-2]|nr:hypothetical protein BZZ01_12120 [Nostocales cyanobacterium HT-58-2]
MNNISRKLSPSEKLFHIPQNPDGAMIMAFVARIEGAITPDIMQQALHFVQKRHLTLQIHIVELPDGSYFQSQGTPEIPLRVIDKQYENQWIEIAENEIHQPFPNPSLWLVVSLCLRISV